MRKVKVLVAAIILTTAFQSCKEKNNNLREVEVPSEPVEEVEATEIVNPADVKADAGNFQIVALPYAYDALAPNIDAKTMEVHYSKHYVGYTNKLNKAIKGTDLENKSIEEILKGLDMNNTAVRNNGGGYYNHSLFWEIMSPNGGGEPSGKLAEAINQDLGSFKNFKTQFTDAASKQFGSGWAWLVVGKDGKLKVTNTPNQDNPLMQDVAVQGTPILGLDVWEHAYYLNYQNKRPEYINAFYNVINWENVAKKYDTAIAQ